MNSLVESLQASSSSSRGVFGRHAGDYSDDVLADEHDMTLWGSAAGYGTGKNAGIKTMEVPRVLSPAAFLSTYTDSMSTNVQAPIHLEHGTTCLAFVYQGGIIVSVDSRASAGSYIASGTVKKVIDVSPMMLSTMAGGAADCQYWLKYVGMQCRLYELREKKKITVAAASKTLQNIMVSYKGYGLSLGTMFCGVDPLRGFSIFYVDNDGQRLKGNLFSVGSGSTFALGVLDQGYRWDLTDEEAEKLGRRAITAAGHRDAYSGNSNNLYRIDKEGWTFLGNRDISELWYEFTAEERGELMAAATSGRKPDVEVVRMEE